MGDEQGGNHKGAPLQGFGVGEEVEVKGVVFVVQRITGERLILMPIPLSVAEIKERERERAWRELELASRLAQRLRRR